jgi:hypothetical protein
MSEPITVSAATVHFPDERPWEGLENVLRMGTAILSNRFKVLSNEKLRQIRSAADATMKENKDPIKYMCGGIVWSCCQLELRERGQAGEEEELHTA